MAAPPPKYLCPIPGCCAELDDHQLFCTEHWKQLPFPIQWTLFESSQSRDLPRLWEQYGAAIELLSHAPAAMIQPTRLDSPLG